MFKLHSLGWHNIEREFSNDPSVLETVKTERLSVHEWIEEHPEESPEIPPRQVAPADSDDSINGNRSIFDDIDGVGFK